MKTIMNREEITQESLIKHALLDTFEFCGFTSGSALSQTYTLQGVGLSFMVGFDVQAWIANLVEKNVNEAIVVHTHPLSNDDTVAHKKMGEGKDPRRSMATGELSLPVGNGPSWGDVEFLLNLKMKAYNSGVLLHAAIYAAGGVWQFDIDPLHPGIQALIENDEDLRILETVGNTQNLPDMYMEVESPNMHKKPLAHEKQSTGTALNALSQTDIVSHTLSTIWSYKIHPLCAKLDLDLIEKGAIQPLKDLYTTAHTLGVVLHFTPYAALGINPRRLMSEGIDSWDKTFDSK